MSVHVKGVEFSLCNTAQYKLLPSPYYYLYNAKCQVILIERASILTPHVSYHFINGLIELQSRVKLQLLGELSLQVKPFLISAPDKKVDRRTLPRTYFCYDQGFC